MNPFRYAVQIVFLFLLVPALGLGQVTLRGVVIDSTTGEGLVGANVHLKGTALGCASDHDGHFIIMRVPKGNYTLVASYIGYATKTVPINVSTTDQTVNFSISPEYVQGSEVVITAQIRGQAAAINQQLSSNTIVNVVSEEKIKELPDANAAEAIGRLPGVSVIRSGGEASQVVLRGLSEKYSSITVDGVRLAATDSTTRGVDLSAISQSSLSGIELYKALTPDMDADAIAGSVNLVTKKAPSLRSLVLNAYGDYNKLNKTAKQFETSLRYGERFFHDVLGVQVIGNLEQRDRSNEDYNVTYNTKFTANDYAITNFRLDFTNETRKRGGANLLLDINTPDSGSIRLSNMYNKTSRDFVLYTRNYFYPTAGGGAVYYTARDREQDIDMFTSSIKGQNFVQGFDIDWIASFSQSRAKFPFDYETDFFDPSGMQSIPQSLWKGPIEAAIPYATNNFDAAYLYYGVATSQKNFDAERTAAVDVTRDYGLGTSLSGTFKFGAKYRSTSRFRDDTQDVSPYYIDGFRPWVVLPDGSIQQKLTSNFVGTRFANLVTINNLIMVKNFLDPTPASRNIYNTYLLYPMVNDDALREWYALSKNGVRDSLGRSPEYSANLEVAANDYDIREGVAAGYIMNTFHIGQNISFIAGLRVESEDNDYLTKYSLGALTGFPTPVGEIGDTSSTHKEAVWLPNFHLTYKATDFMTVRLAAYKALARPDFNQRLNDLIARNGGQLGGVTLVVGNSKLKDARSWNYEVNTSFFGNTIGLITLSAFYKDIRDLPHTLNGVTGVGQRFLDSLGVPWNDPFLPITPYSLTYPINSDKPSRVWGFEFEHQTNLGFLPGLLRNIVLSYNFSLIRSETYIPFQIERVDTITVQTEFGPVRQPVRTLYFVSSKQSIEGMPQFSMNAALGYDIGGFSARVSVYHQGQYNQSFSYDHESDVVVNPFTRWDFSAKQNINDRIAVMFNLDNFTNAEEGTSLVDRTHNWTLLTTSQKFGLSANLGVQVTVY